jgi:ABC-type protease/lipase transport system fused ATPase/permease subunit
MHPLADLVRANDVANIALRGRINQQQAAVVIRELSAMPRLLELQIVDMNEMPTIELFDNGIYKDSGNLSTGQKFLAILPILLWEGNCPLVIDQPEDNLDNRFICDTVAPALKSVKSMRQLIFITHNPNIPVLGDASRVIVMQSDGQSGRVKKAGSVNGCGAEIVALLEGGQKAFDKRESLRQAQRQTRP